MRVEYVSNRIALSPKQHKKFTNFWKMILREIKDMNKNE